MDDPRPKKKKVIGFKVTSKTKTYTEGNSTADLNFKHGPVKKDYKVESAETGHPAYGKAGSGTHPEMNALLDKARANKQDHTDHSSKGLSYKAGTTITTKKPDLVSSTIKIKPTMKMVVRDFKPKYATVAGGERDGGGGLKKMSVTLGGSDRKGNPANKQGIGSKNGVRVTKSKSFKKPGY